MEVNCQKQLCYQCCQAKLVVSIVKIVTTFGNNLGSIDNLDASNKHNCLEIMLFNHGNVNI